MAGNAIELGRYIVSQGWCYFEVMTADRQVHEYPPFALAVEKSPVRNKRPRNLEMTMRPIRRKSNPATIARYKTAELGHCDFWRVGLPACNRLRHRYKMFA
jgi:hypothetical protein